MWELNHKEGSESHSVVSDFLWPHGLYIPWNSPGHNTGVGWHSPNQRIFPTQGSDPGLPHCRRILYQLSHKGSPIYMRSWLIIKWATQRKVLLFNWQGNNLRLAPMKEKENPKSWVQEGMMRGAHWIKLFESRHLKCTKENLSHESKILSKNIL